MADPKEPPFDADGAAQEGSDDYEETAKALHYLINDFAEEHDLPDAAVSLLLLDIAVKARMADYVVSVEKPSGSGLKLELDRMRREADEMIREAKKVADGYVAHAKEALKELEEEDKGD
jgi:hypothetical protein